MIVVTKSPFLFGAGRLLRVLRRAAFGGIVGLAREITDNLSKIDTDTHNCQFKYSVLRNVAPETCEQFFGALRKWARGASGQGLLNAE